MGSTKPATDTNTRQKEFGGIHARDYAAQHPVLFAFVKDRMSRPGKQFLLIGDTDHNNPLISDFIDGLPVMALLQHAGISHSCIEQMRELLPPYQIEIYSEQAKRHQAGMLSDDEFKKFEGTFCRHSAIDFTNFWIMHTANRQAFQNPGAKNIDTQELKQRQDALGNKGPSIKLLYNYVQAGIRITAADSLQWRECLPIDEERKEKRKPFAPFRAETENFEFYCQEVACRLLLGDPEVAAYIDRKSAGQKTAVIYGDAHFSYKDGMRARLDRDKCLYIAFYANRRQYEKSMLERNPVERNVFPDRIYFIEERILDRPDPDSLYGEYIKKDHSLIAANAHFDRAMRLTRHYFGPHASPEEKTEAQGRVTRLDRIDPRYLDYIPLNPA